MSSVLDHLTAVLIGSVLILSLLMLQTRDRTDAVADTGSDVARTHVESVLDVVSQDMENVMGEEAAVAAGLAAYRGHLVRAGDQTAEVEVTAWVQSAGGPVAPAYVRYRLAATGETVDVGGTTYPTHTLLRAVDLGGSGVYGPDQPVGTGIVAFAAVFVGASGEQHDGPQPLRFSQIRVHLGAAVDAPAARAGDPATARRTNLVQMGATFRPRNLAVTP